MFTYTNPLNLYLLLDGPYTKTTCMFPLQSDIVTVRTQKAIQRQLVCTKLFTKLCQIVEVVTHGSARSLFNLYPLLERRYTTTSNESMKLSAILVYKAA